MSGAEVLARPGGRAARPTGSPWVTRGLVVAAVLVFGLVAGSAPTTGPALDPRSTGPSGLRGVLDVLREVGVPVEIDTVDDGSATTVLALPGVPPEDVEALVAPGRRVVSTVTPEQADDVLTELGVPGLGVVDLPVDCELLAGVDTLASSAWNGWQLPVSADTCVAVGDGWWLARTGTADNGEHVHLFDLGPLVNARLAGSDAGLAAVRLLAPGPGSGTGASNATAGLLVLEPGPQQREGLGALVVTRVWDAAALLVVAVLLLAAARGRRLGAPPDEQLPVRVPGGELVRALGDLRTRAEHRGATLQALRRHTLDQLRHTYQLTADAPVDRVLAAHDAAGRTTPPGSRAALEGPTPTDDERLVELARVLRQLRATTAASTPERSGPPGRTAPTPSHDLDDWNDA